MDKEAPLIEHETHLIMERYYQRLILVEMWNWVYALVLEYFLIGCEFCRECRFMCLFRHKIWWMIPRFGSSASDIRMETQMLLLEVREESAVQDDDSTLVQSTDNNTSYVLFLPVLEGQFRATLQGNSANELEFCVESG